MIPAPTAIDGALLGPGASALHRKLTVLVVDSHRRGGKSMEQAERDAAPVVDQSFRLACEVRGNPPGVWMPRRIVRIGRATLNVKER